LPSRVHREFRNALELRTSWSVGALELRTLDALRSRVFLLDCGFCWFLGDIGRGWFHY